MPDDVGEMEEESGDGENKRRPLVIGHGHALTRMIRSYVTRHVEASVRVTTTDRNVEKSLRCNVFGGSRVHTLVIVLEAGRDGGGRIIE